MLVLGIFDLVLSCGVIVVSPVVGNGVIIKMNLSIPFRFWLASKQKGAQG